MCVYVHGCVCVCVRPLLTPLCQALSKLGLKQIPGVDRVAMRKSKTVCICVPA